MSTEVAMNEVILFKQLSQDAIMPTQATEQSAGYDLFSMETYALRTGERKLFSLGFSMALSPGMVALICSRSGLTFKHGVFVLNAPGIIDSDYRGEVGVILHNSGRFKYEVKKGDRIAQMLVIKHFSLFPDIVQELPETVRGTGGFGSTGT